MKAEAGAPARDHATVSTTAGAPATPSTPVTPATTAAGKAAKSENSAQKQGSAGKGKATPSTPLSPPSKGKAKAGGIAKAGSIGSRPAPASLQVTCQGMTGTYLPAVHKVICRCPTYSFLGGGGGGSSSKAGGNRGSGGGGNGNEGHSISLSEFEKHSGCRNKKWKSSVYLVDPGGGRGQALNNWVSGCGPCKCSCVQIAFKLGVPAP